MKILHFGTIHEDGDGKLVLQSFAIDGEGYTGWDQRTCLIDLVIERLRLAKEEIQGFSRGASKGTYCAKW